jgi:hypothetical protein
MPPTLQFHKVLIPRFIIDRKDWVKYLVLVNWHAQELEDVLTRRPDAKFTAFVEDQVRAYLDGKAAPEAIQPAIMNIVDEMAGGKEVTLRAGDYIALQGHYMRGAKKTRARR